MRTLVAIDDTDNLESRGTGALASLIAEAVQQNGWGDTGIVTRHQLLVHPDIPYTSHNSSTCFVTELNEGCLEPLISFACDFLDNECASGSDPGLCVAVLDRITDLPGLVAFGQRAKQEVLTMTDAYDLAGRLGVHLSAHGGTGQGVIGALAGTGLRLWGNDGRMKGSLAFGGQEFMRVADLLAHPDVDAVRCIAGGNVDIGDLVAIGEKPKTVMLDGLSVLLLAAVAPEGGGACWQTLPRKQLRGY
jgi:hypothetical protein